MLIIFDILTRCNVRNFSKRTGERSDHFNSIYLCGHFQRTSREGKNCSPAKTVVLRKSQFVLAKNF